MSNPYGRQRHHRPERVRYRHPPYERRPPKDPLTTLLTNDVFQQVAPLLVIVLVPLLVLVVHRHKRTLLSPVRYLAYALGMVLQVLAGALPWNWSAGSKERKSPEKKKAVRTRADQLQNANGSASQGSSKDVFDGQRHNYDPEDAEDDGYYPGIVNISGTYCFMDSTLQALASLNYLQPHIDNIHARAEEFDVATPVVDALRDILHELNTPRSSRTSLRPYALIEALSAPAPSSSTSGPRSNRLFSSREHQDAQELFQVLIEAVKNEAAEVAREAGRDLGLGGALSAVSSASKLVAQSTQVDGTVSPHRDRELEASNITKSVFDGLTANRRSCVQCGYTEAVMHFSFDSWQLALPRSNVCELDDCLADYTRLELLTDCICRRCSLEATYEKYSRDGVLEQATSSSPSSPIANSPIQDVVEEKAPVSKSKKKRAQEARKLASRVKALLDEGRVEDDVKGVQIVKVARPSTKQAMVARPPPVLVLHLNRSLHFGGYYGAAKNTCRVVFPEILDLTPYTTGGMLNTSPQVPMSGPGFRSTLFAQAPAETKVDLRARTLYRLGAVVCHYGQHSFGHYVCYRRRPRSVNLPEEKRWEPPTWRGDDEGALAALASKRGTGRGWLRISDDDVRECGIESVLQEGVGAFMLYYEKIAFAPAQPLSRTPSTSASGHRPEETQPVANGDSAHPIPEARVHRVYAIEDDERTPRCSEETLKPPGASNGYRKANGSIASLASTLVDEAHLDDALKGKSGVQSAAALGLSNSPLSRGVWEPRLVRSVSLSTSRASSRPPVSRAESTGKANGTGEEGVPNGHVHGVNGEMNGGPAKGT